MLEIRYEFVKKKNEKNTSDFKKIMGSFRRFLEEKVYLAVSASAGILGEVSACAQLRI
jgi:hypothetical protein